MPDKTQWQRPVELPPDAITPTASSQTEPRLARDIPLEQTQPLPEESSSQPPMFPHRQRRRHGWLLLLLILAGLAIGAELYRLINWSVAIHPLLGGAFAVLTAALLLMIGLEVKHGLRGRRQLGQVESLQDRARQLLQQASHGDSAALLQQLSHRYQDTALNREMQAAIAQLDSSYNDREVVQYLDRHALSQTDQAARRCVQRYSVESGVMVALSPWASFDMLLVAWRNLRMVREIATLYGIAPGLLTQGKLLKQILHNLAFAGASEVAMDAGSALLGSSLTSSLSARAGQGIGAGLFTARTGLTAIKLCRPLPEQDQPKGLLQQIARGIVQKLGGQKGNRNTDSMS